MVKPLHSSFRISQSTENGSMPELIYTDTHLISSRKRDVLPGWRSTIHHCSRTKRDFWEENYMTTQDELRRAEVKIESLEEDHRQMRRRINELEDHICSKPQSFLKQSSDLDNEAMSIDNDRVPMKEVILLNSKARCGFYLTDGEGLSDIEDVRFCDDQGDWGERCDESESRCR